MAGRPKGSGGKAEELSPEEIRRIDDCLTGSRHEMRNRALFFLGLGSGMRISEIVALRVENVAPLGDVLSYAILEKRNGPSLRIRTVALSIQAVEHLKNYLSNRGPNLQPDSPVFPSQKHADRPMNSTWAVQLLNQIFTQADVSNASSHSLRRTHANTLRRNGADMMIIKKQLGHSSLSTTQRYFKADPIEIQMAVNHLRF